MSSLQGSNMIFKVLSSGIFSTIQDEGRYGYAHLGVRTSGAMDGYAYMWSQTLLQQQNINAIEIMVGLKLQALINVTIAITGADLDFKINGSRSDIWQTHKLDKGDILTFQRRLSGQRSYLAIAGGFDVPKSYGSYSTTLKEGIGSRVERDDILKSLNLNTLILKNNSPTFRVQPDYIPHYKKPIVLRIILGYQEKSFSQEEKDKFFNSDYKITLESDRMGFRLHGEAIKADIDGIISEGIAFGAVQIPQDGQPIVLLRERQTIGGYPKIGTVLEEDCFKLTQKGVDCLVRFKEVFLEEILIQNQ